MQRHCFYRGCHFFHLLKSKAFRGLCLERLHSSLVVYDHYQDNLVRAGLAQLQRGGGAHLSCRFFRFGIWLSSLGRGHSDTSRQKQPQNYFLHREHFTPNRSIVPESCFVYKTRRIRWNSLGVLELGYGLGYGGDVVEIGEVGVAGQGVALVAFYQNFHASDSGNVC
jgi:hypothetical protein